MINAEELAQVSDAIELGKLRRTMKTHVENNKNALASLWHWISRAWREIFPALDMTSTQFSEKWHTLAELQTHLRKLVLLPSIYNPAVENPWENNQIEGIKGH